MAECSRQSWHLCFKSFCCYPEVKVRCWLLMSSCCEFMFSLQHKVMWNALPTSCFSTMHKPCYWKHAVRCGYVCLMVSLFPVGVKRMLKSCTYSTWWANSWSSCMIPVWPAGRCQSSVPSSDPSSRNISTPQTSRGMSVNFYRLSLNWIICFSSIFMTILRKSLKL